jgi:hypothetical protein
MTQAVEEAKAINYQADLRANDMAEILHGRLRKVSVSRLKKLKRELSQFNAATGKWKENA